MSAARVAMWTLALGLLAGAVALWPDVPARLPVHFGAGGAPDAWAGRSLAAWLGLPVVGLVLAVGFEGLAVWMRRPGAPGLNLPNKDAILALPAERRAVVLDRVADLLYGSGAASLAAFALLQAGTWTAAHGESGAGWVVAGVLTAVVAPLGVLVGGLVRVSAETRRQQGRG